MFSELLCFLKSHFGVTPLPSILTVIASYYSEDDICKAKLVLHEICLKNMDESDVPRLQTRKGDNKRKSDSEDIGKYFSLLDDHKVALPKFAALNAKRIPQIDPANVDLCFLLESVEEMRKTIISLTSMKDDISKLQSAVSVLSRPVQQTNSSSSRDVNPIRSGGASFQQASSASAMPQQKQSAQQASFSNVLRVNLPPLSDNNGPVARGAGSSNFVSKKPIVGTKAIANGVQSKLKASTAPRPFHIYVGNLDVSSAPSDVEDSLKEVGIKVLSCEFLRKSNVRDDFSPRSHSARITVDFSDKDKALLPSTWEAGIFVRPWRMPRRYKEAQSRDWNEW